MLVTWAAFSPFPAMFSSLPKTNFNFSVTFIMSSLTLSKTTILDSSKLKEFAEDNFKFDENGRNFSKRVDNIVGKGEIARYEQFLFSHSVFKSLVLQTRKYQGLFGKGLKVAI